MWRKWRKIPTQKALHRSSALYVFDAFNGDCVRRIWFRKYMVRWCHSICEEKELVWSDNQECDHWSWLWVEGLVVDCVVLESIEWLLARMPEHLLGWNIEVTTDNDLIDWFYCTHRPRAQHTYNTIIIYRYFGITILHTQEKKKE